MWYVYSKVFHLGLHLADITPGHLTSEVTVVEDQAWKWVKSPLFTLHWPELMHSCLISRSLGDSASLVFRKRKHQ